MDWFVAFVENSKSLPLVAQASVLMMLSWGEVSGGVVVLANVATRDAQRGWRDGQFVEGLTIAVAAGWLAPIEELPDGSLRTSLRVPEGGR